MMPTGTNSPDTIWPGVPSLVAQVVILDFQSGTFQTKNFGLGLRFEKRNKRLTSCKKIMYYAPRPECSAQDQFVQATFQ